MPQRPASRSAKTCWTAFERKPAGLVPDIQSWSSRRSRREGLSSPGSSRQVAETAAGEGVFFYIADQARHLALDLWLPPGAYLGHAPISAAKSSNRLFQSTFPSSRPTTVFMLSVRAAFGVPPQVAECIEHTVPGFSGHSGLQAECTWPRNRLRSSQMLYWGSSPILYQSHTRSCLLSRFLYHAYQPAPNHSAISLKSFAAFQIAVLSAWSHFFRALSGCYITAVTQMTPWSNVFPLYWIHA